MSIQRRSSSYQQRAQVVRTIRVNDDDIGPPGRNGDKVRMRDTIPLAAGHVNFVRHERHCAVELPNGFNNHRLKLTAQAGVVELVRLNSGLNSAFDDVDLDGLDLYALLFKPSDGRLDHRPLPGHFKAKDSDL